MIHSIASTDRCFDPAPFKTKPSLSHASPKSISLRRLHDVLLARQQYGAIDVGHVASTVGDGQVESPDPACVLALVRALQYNTFFTHLDLSTANAAAGCWSGEDPTGTSDVASGPMALAVQVCRCLGYRVPGGSRGGTGAIGWFVPSVAASTIKL